MRESLNKKTDQNNTILVLGGDGFCGWATSLYLSNHGYDVTIIDNLSRRNIDNELEAYSLTPIQPMNTRLKTWKEITGREIRFINIDVAQNYFRLLKILEEIKPKAVIHFAEQRAAPYSMKSTQHKRYTINNNINATHNILCAIVESGLDIHLVHLGTMGVYGYSTSGIKIPEGYLEVQVMVNGQAKSLEIPYPVDPGSIYHMTKTQDALMFYYYNKNDHVKITDLHQGIVWGTNTDETLMDERLINRFDYDGDYGTVLNRFLMQAAIGYPLTVYGTGGQTRAFIHIRDSVRCLKFAIEHPPASGERVEVFNQATETHNIKWLAEKVSVLTDVEIQYLSNPRNEMPENELIIANEKFLSLGLIPITLNDGLLEEVIQIAKKYKDRCDISKIPYSSTWRRSVEKAQL